MTSKEELLKVREEILSKVPPDRQAWLREQYAEEDAYEESQERINYDLKYYCDCPFTQSAIVRAIHRLPSDVREFSLGECIFLSIGQAAAGKTLPGRIQETGWIIVLDEREFSEATDEEEALSVVAHEIAHAWLKHDCLSPDCPKDCEIAAANLAGEWGFTGRGTDPSFCDRRLQG